MTLEDIMLDYFASKMDKKFTTDEVFVNKIKKLGVEDEKAKDIFLNIDDEWTKEHINLENEKKSKMMKLGGIILFSIGLFLTVYTFLIYKSVSILFYGLILGGILSYFGSKNISSEVNKKRQLRKLVIKGWN